MLRPCWRASMLYLGANGVEPLEGRSIEIEA